MRALSLWQPWATLCVLAMLRHREFPVKPYETRDWSTDYRGPLVIHAARKWTRELRETIAAEPFRSALAAYGYPACGTGLPLGRVVGVVELVEVWQVLPGGSGGRGYLWSASRGLRRPLPTSPAFDFGDFSVGRYAWELRNPQWFGDGFPLRGRQGLWTLSAEEEEAVRERMADGAATAREEVARG